MAVANKVFTADKYIKALEEVRPMRILGKVTRVAGSLIESQGPPAQVGEVCLVGDGGVRAEVIGFRTPNLLLTPFASMQGIAPGATVRATGKYLTVGVGPDLLGRVLDGLGQPLDGKGPIGVREEYPLENSPPPSPPAAPDKGNNACGCAGSGRPPYLWARAKNGYFCRQWCR